VDDHDVESLAESEPSAPTPEEPLPPVVTRLVVEIRSDGTRTIARGALEDAESGQDVAVAIEADTPAALLVKLTRTLATLPSMIRGTRAHLPEATPEATRPRRPSIREAGARLRRRLGRRLKGR